MTQRKFNSLPPGGGYRPKGKTVKSLEAKSINSVNPEESDDANAARQVIKSRLFDFHIAGERYAKRVFPKRALAIEACALLAIGEVSARAMPPQDENGEVRKIMNWLLPKDQPEVKEPDMAALFEQYQNLGYIALQDGALQLQPAARNVLPESTVQGS